MINTLANYLKKFFCIMGQAMIRVFIWVFGTVFFFILISIFVLVVKLGVLYFEAFFDVDLRLGWDVVVELVNQIFDWLKEIWEKWFGGADDEANQPAEGLDEVVEPIDSGAKGTTVKESLDAVVEQTNPKATKEAREVTVKESLDAVVEQTDPETTEEAREVTVKESLDAVVEQTDPEATEEVREVTVKEAGSETAEKEE